MESLVDQIGGEENLAVLINRFYDLMETLPNAADIHRLHFRGHGIEQTRQQQIDFMSGFMGGRAYYREQHGHMDLREIHAHVPIRTEDAETWLGTWDHALDDCNLTGPHIDKLRMIVRRVALMLVNDVPDWRKGEI